MSIKHIDQIVSTKVPEGTEVSRKVLISSSEAPHFAMRVFTIQPGGSMPNHTNQVEHEQFVLRGTAEIGIGSDVLKVSSGDIVFIPAEVPHYYRNIGKDPFEFICVVPNLPDQTRIMGK